MSSLALFCLLPCAVAQGGVAGPSPKQFEAASLRPAAPGVDRARSARLLDLAAKESDAAPSLLSVDFTLLEFVVLSYGVRYTAQHPALMRQMPDWAMKDVYHLSARLPAGATYGDMEEMLRSLLQERVHLRAHQETMVRPVFLLQVERPGASGIKQHNGTCDATGTAGPEDICGVRTSGADGMIRIAMTGQSMPAIAEQLGGMGYYMGGQPALSVVDDTGLAGLFDITFTFVPLFRADTPGGPTLMDVLHKDLGLRLIKGQRSMPALIVDHMEQPTTD